MLIDSSFDFRTDARGRDPDSFSPTLRRYHRFLWSKPLPDGRPFDLDDTTKRVYLHHQSDIGEFWLASDSVMQTFTRWAAARHVLERLPIVELDWFVSITYTIGGMLIFPGNRVEGKATINGARGLHRSIADRMDLTLECIRRHYLDVPSPLSETLNRYREFFRLFGSFRGYLEFFLLQDLVSRDMDQVTFFAPFDDFRTPAIPRDVETYAGFMRKSIAFVEARNRRITEWAQQQDQGTADSEARVAQP